LYSLSCYEQRAAPSTGRRRGGPPTATAQRVSGISVHSGGTTALVILGISLFFWRRKIDGHYCYLLGMLHPRCLHGPWHFWRLRNVAGIPLLKLKLDTNNEKQRYFCRVTFSYRKWQILALYTVLCSTTTALFGTEGLSWKF
jgi:hypothetical protein